jgi:hypothetical protein
MRGRLHGSLHWTTFEGTRNGVSAHANHVGCGTRNSADDNFRRDIR